MEYVGEKSTQRGFSLVEVIIAIAILAIILAGVYQVYISMHGVWVSQELKAETQQTGRVALDYMQRDLMMAGYRSMQYHTNKGSEDKILFATLTTIVFDRWLEAPVSQNRIIKYYLKNTGGKKDLYRAVYTDFDDVGWKPATPDTANFGSSPPGEQVVSENISLLKFLYYTIDNPNTLADYDWLAASQDNRNKIVKIQVIIQSKSTKVDPTTKDYYVLTNSMTVTPVNLRTTETVSDPEPPGRVTGLNVVDSRRCSTLKARWDANNESDLAGYILYWGRATGDYEGSETIPVGSLSDRAHPTWDISNLLVTKGATVNTYYLAVRAYDNSLNYGAISTEVHGNPFGNVTAFGDSRGDDTTINVRPPESPPANFTAENIADNATVGQNHVKLTWTPDPEATQGYRIYRNYTSADFTYPIVADGTYVKLLADFNTLGPSATTYTDTDAALKTCKDYRYAICTVNCDETLVQNYGASKFSTLIKAPTNTESKQAPDINTNTKGGYRRIFVNLKNPDGTGYNSDFQYTMVYFHRVSGSVSYPEVDADGNLTVGTGQVVPNSDCGTPGKFITKGTVPTFIFNDEDRVRPDSEDPGLGDDTQYTLLAVAHYKCRGTTSAQGASITLSSLCGDDQMFLGAPGINGGNWTTEDPDTHVQTTHTYTGLVVGKSGGCIFSNFTTGVENTLPARFTWTFGGQNSVIDYAGVFVTRTGTDGATVTWGPLWAGPLSDAGIVDGNTYTYKFKLCDCAYANHPSERTTTYASNITSDTDAIAVTVAPGNITRLSTDTTTVFGNMTSVTNGSFYHNAVKFNIVNTAAADLTIQRLENITWDNTDAYLKRVIIGPAPSPGVTTRYEQAVSVPDGSQLSTDGTKRIASVSFTTNPLIQDHASPSTGPSNPIPVTLEFVNSAGTVDRFVDMRGTTISMIPHYTNTSTDDPSCTRHGTITVSLGPSVIGVVQDKPISPTVGFEVPGSSGSNTPPVVVVEGGTKVNVLNTVFSNTFKNGSSISLSSIRLYYKDTFQNVTTAGTSGFSNVNMPRSGSSTLYTLLSGSTDNRIPILEGRRIWYYVVARDIDGNFDRAPLPGNGYFTYDQKMFSICDKTPKAPALAATKYSASGNDYANLSWTKPTQYTDGSDIDFSADSLTYDGWRQDGFSSGYAQLFTNRTSLSYNDPTRLTQPTKYKVVAKNACADPGPNVSPDSNEYIICAGTGGGCSVNLKESFSDNSPTLSTVYINTNWSNHSSDSQVPVYLSVYICDRVQDGSTWSPADGVYDPMSDITLTITTAQGAETSNITLYEVGGDSGLFMPLSNPGNYVTKDGGDPNSKAPVYITATAHSGNDLIQAATKSTSLTDTVTFMTDSGITNCANVSSVLSVFTDPCSNTPKQVTGVTVSILSHSGNTYSVRVSWTGVTQNTDGSTINDLTNYRVYLDGATSTSYLASSGTNFYDLSIKKNTGQGVNNDHTVQVSAVDSCNTEGAKSISTSFIVQ